MAYDIGDEIELAAEKFVDRTGTPQNPTTVTLKIQKPDLTEATHTYPTAGMSRPETGDYRFALVVDQAGTWYYRWQGVGVVNQARQKSFEVNTSEF